VTIPGTNTIIDLSHWNPVNSFPDIKAGGVDTIIHKCTQGVGFDPAYSTRRAMAIGCGLLWGAYHFGVASQDPVKQADFFLSMSHRPKVMALDWEWNNVDTMTPSQADAFVRRVHSITGQWPLVYTSAAFLNQLDEHFPASLDNCDLWVTGFTGSPIVPWPWDGKWAIWQHGLAPCPGIDGQVDRDTFNGTPADLAAYFTF
jgi:lysozyme